MKRYNNTYPKVKKINSLFWRECRFCGSEFRLEKGFKIVDYTKINPELYNSYCCGDCASSCNEVIIKIKQTEAYRNKKMMENALKMTTKMHETLLNLEDKIDTVIDKYNKIK